MIDQTFTAFYVLELLTCNLTRSRLSYWWYPKWERRTVDRQLYCNYTDLGYACNRVPVCRSLKPKKISTWIQQILKIQDRMHYSHTFMCVKMSEC